MKESGNKILGEERKRLILSWLKESDEPLSGKVLAQRTNVSRQVIVQDVSLLKAKGEPIMATSSGYIYFKDQQANNKQTRVIAVSHQENETKDELYLLVDQGVSILNVMVEHPIYGDLTSSLLIRNRRDADKFIKEIEKTNAALLSKLTNGVHLHTIEADTIQQLDDACLALRVAGFLLEE